MALEKSATVPRSTASPSSPAPCVRRVRGDIRYIDSSRVQCVYACTWVRWSAAPPSLALERSHASSSKARDKRARHAWGRAGEVVTARDRQTTGQDSLSISSGIPGCTSSALAMEIDQDISAKIFAAAARVTGITRISSLRTWRGCEVRRGSTMRVLPSPPLHALSRLRTQAVR